MLRGNLHRGLSNRHGGEHLAAQGRDRERAKRQSSPGHAIVHWIESELIESTEGSVSLSGVSARRNHVSRSLMEASSLDMRSGNCFERIAELYQYFFYALAGLCTATPSGPSYEAPGEICRGVGRVNMTTPPETRGGPLRERES
jgi:hypothetical protein